MPRLDPFIGTRYADAMPLDRVIAPPYDVVTPEQRARLAARHPANAVRVELPEPDPARGLDRYGVAVELLSAWRDQGTLADDPTPALYPYRMTAPDGHTSTGVIGALTVDDEEILPHEETLPKPASDRLDLLRATHANLSPIWGLSLAPGLTAAVEPTGPPTMEAVDDDGVRHELWVTSDPAVVGKIVQIVHSAPIVMADGHHRLETARNYHAERRAAGSSDERAPDAAVMALVMELTPSELTVGPIHRAISGLPDGADLTGAFRRWFDLVRAGPSDERTLTAVAEPGGLALVTKDSTWLLTPLPDAAEAAGNELDTAAVALALGGLPTHEVTHCHSREEALAELTEGPAQAVVLLRPVPVDTIAEWARARRRMPPKSTYFWPKPRTGMVFRTWE